jgi:hypothetical protein
MAEYQEDDEVSTATTSNGLGSLLDHLGALREHRASETTTSLPLPGFEGRLWATYRLPDAAKATQVATMSAAGHQSLLGACMDLLAATTTGLYTGPNDPDGKVHDEDGHLNPGYAHLPGGTDEMPVTFAAATRPGRWPSSANRSWGNSGPSGDAACGRHVPERDRPRWTALPRDARSARP